MAEHTIVIRDGALRFIYSDDLADFLDLGESPSVCRVSHVEPCAGPHGAPGTWWDADMSPVNGPRLGPFKLREDALAAEREWLQRERGL